MRTILIISILAAGMTAMSVTADTSAPDVVSGKVFIDANNNGVHDNNEKGLAGIRVTDGVGFVITDKDGAYSIGIGADPMIPARSAQTVGICWPTGMWPSGRWWVRLSKIEDAKAVNFGLRSEEQKIPFVYLHMTDPHEYFNTAHMDFAEFVNAMPPDLKFIIDTGDSYRPASAEKPFNRLFFSTVGNHDTWELPNPPPEGRFGAWTDRLGPLRWSFDYAGIHFVGVDVIEGEKTEPMLNWLEKDLAVVPKETRIVLNYHYPDPSGPPRFTKLLKEYRIEVIHGGHDHAYGWSDDMPSVVRAYHWQPPGTCNLAVVSKDRIDIGVYCIGCKKTFDRHSRRCSMDWIDHLLLSDIRSLFTKLHTIDSGPLPGPKTIKLTDPHVFVKASMDPSGAKRTGIKISGDKLLEIVFTGDRLIVDGASVPFTLRRGQKTLDLTIFVHHKMLTIWANNYFFMEKRAALTRADEVTLFSEGGAASVKSATVQEVKTDPDNRKNVFACACNHGVMHRYAVPR